MTLSAASWVGLLLCALAAGWAWSRRSKAAVLPEVVTPAPVPWFELLSALGPLVASAPSRAEAVQALAQLLRSELGVQQLRLFHVRGVEAASASVQLWPEDPLLRSPQPQSVDLTQAPLGLAIRRTSVAGDEGAGFAMAWPGLALDFASAGLNLQSETLLQLLGVAHTMVATQSSSQASERISPEAKPAVDSSVLSQQLIESLPASMFVFEPSELRLMSINQEAEREFSLDRNEVTGRTLVEAFGMAASQVAEPRMREALASEGVVECDYAWTNRLGARVLQVRHRALRDPQGQALLLLVVARDVTAQRQTQNELQESRNRFLEFSEAMEDSLFISNPERTAFYFLAGSTYDLWGVTPEHVARGELFHRIVEEDRHLLEERARCERALQPADFVFRVIHPQKGLTFIRTRSRTSVMPDGSLRVYGVVSDVTKEQTREDQLKAARDAAETASQAKSHFMANMSHEIRTPMNGILGMTELLLNSSLTERQRHFAEAVYQSGESLLATLDDVLDYAKLDAGRLELVSTDFLLRAVVEDTLELLAPRAHQKRLELNFVEHEGTPEWVRGDPLRLRQVLSKFVANGIKFTHSGEVVVSVRCSRSDRSGCVLEFSVSDTGQGMDASVLPRLFTPFTQAEAGMSRQHEGVGLGLAIAGRLVSLMGGSVSVQSSLGVGSVFGFSLPFGEAQASEVALDTSLGRLEAEPGAPIRVLVVEDHATSRQVLQHMSRDSGMQVSGVENGQQALAALREAASSPHPFDVALVDIHMPLLDGLSMGRVVRQDPQFQALKLVLMSSSASADDVRQAQKIGFQGFLSKPVRRADLRQMIASVCSGQKDRVNLTPRLSGRVLVVEDNVVNQEVIGQMLRKLHLDIQVAGSALQGLRALCEHSFDLVLMDIMMPGMDGIEALRWFRQGTDERFEFKTHRETPVVAVTANALEGDEARFLALGFNGYLSKPLRQSHLIQMLSKHLPLNDSDLPTMPVTLPADLEAREPVVLDPSALSRLRELDPRGENQLIQRVIGAFQTSVARLVPQLEDARRAGDLAGVRHVAHTFKSSSASIGATELSQRCTELETLIRLDQVDNLDQRVDDLCKEIALVSKALQTLLDRQS